MFRFGVGQSFKSVKLVTVPVKNGIKNIKLL